MFKDHRSAGTPEQNRVNGSRCNFGFLGYVISGYFRNQTLLINKVRKEITEEEENRKK